MDDTGIYKEGLRTTSGNLRITILWAGNRSQDSAEYEVGVLTTSLSFSFGFNYFMSSRKEGE
jgi:hypothetical protein